jgi:23S rRNA pseudouridine1911/1915/1917 synthase
VSDVELIEIRFSVAEQHHGWRLDRFIQARIPRLSRTRIQRMIRAQQALGGISLRPSSRVQAGQDLVLLRPAPDEPDVPRDYRVIYEDEQLIAIDKPAGLPVHATARYHKNTLTALLRERYPEGAVPRLVHRLDRETSGVMLLARDRSAEVALKEALAARAVKKQYLAIVWGDPGEQGVVDGAIGPHPESGIRVKMCVRADGQHALTQFQRLERRRGYSLVEAWPKTGRQHQIRVHMQHAGSSIVGDKLYGPDPSLMLEHLETGWTEQLAERLELSRHALHAASVTFEHPVKRQPLTISCPLASELEQFWQSKA